MQIRDYEIEVHIFGRYCKYLDLDIWLERKHLVAVQNNTPDHDGIRIHIIYLFIYLFNNLQITKLSVN